MARPGVVTHTSPMVSQIAGAAAAVSPRRRRAAAIVGGGALFLGVANLVVILSLGLPVEVALSPDVIAGVAAPAMGLLVLRRQPRNAVGWVFLAIGWASAAWATSTLALMAGLPPTGVGTVVASLATWAYYPAYALMFGVVPLLFPDGRVPSRAWRPAAGAIGLVIAVSAFLEAFGQPQAAAAPVDNPLHLPVVEALALRMEPALVWVWRAVVVVAAAAPLRRFVGSSGALRAQLLWLASAVVVGAAALLFARRGVVLTVALPVATAVAILRYRLYDIEVVVRQAVTYGGLAAAVTTVCVAIIVGIGSLPERSTSDLRLIIVATVVAVLIVQPLRGRLLSVAHRLVYGPRATPYQALSGLGERIGAAMSAGEVLPAMAAAVGAALPVDAVTVRAYLADDTSASASWPPDEQDRPGVPQRVAISHRGADVGEIEVRVDPRTTLSPSEHRLLGELADHAGPAVEAVALSAELEHRLAELTRQAAQLRASRARLVAAEDQARRKIERDIHDGAQQQLLALAVDLGRAQRLVDRDPDAAAELLRALRERTGRTLADLRSLASGAFPPALRELGVGPALRSRMLELQRDVLVTDKLTRRLPSEIEAAIYFICLEAVQNATKHASSASVTVDLRDDGDAVTFTVSDDGPGFDPTSQPQGHGLQNIADRAEALGGTVEVHSERGTRVAGQIPVSPPVTAGT